jgi:hypothetical protein
MSEKDKKPHKSSEKSEKKAAVSPEETKKAKKKDAAPKEESAPKKKKKKDEAKVETPVAAEPVGEVGASSAEQKVAAKPTHAQIAERAHHYFVERGHRHGSHEEDWLRAERELGAR